MGDVSGGHASERCAVTQAVPHVPRGRELDWNLYRIRGNIIRGVRSAATLNFQARWGMQCAGGRASYLLNI